jgi:hypothetical protein
MSENQPKDDAMDAACSKKNEVNTHENNTGKGPVSGA